MTKLAVTADVGEIRWKFGRQVASRRTLRGWTQAELGSCIGREQATISRWESGDREPSLVDLARLSDVLECSVDELLGATA